MDTSVPHRGWLPAIGTVLSARYRLQELLGAGPTGGVFRAEDQRDGAEVALKVFDPSLLSGEYRRVNLFRISRTLGYEHPNLLPVLDVQTAGDHAWIVQGLSSGAPLSSYVRGRPPLTHGEVVDLFEQLTGAAAAIHSLSAVHGNLKPSNVLVTPDGRVAVCDAYQLLGAWPETDTDAVLLAPEQRGGDDVEEERASDVWSLALLLGLVLARAPVLPGVAISAQGPGIPSAVDALFLEATQMSPELRIKSVSRFMRQLREAMPPDEVVVTTVDEVEELEAVDDVDEVAAAELAEAEVEIVEEAAEPEAPVLAVVDADALDWVDAEELDWQDVEELDEVEPRQGADWGVVEVLDDDLVEVDEDGSLDDVVEAYLASEPAGEPSWTDPAWQEPEPSRVTEADIVASVEAWRAESDPDLPAIEGPKKTEAAPDQPTAPEPVAAVEVEPEPEPMSLAPKAPVEPAAAPAAEEEPPSTATPAPAHAAPAEPARPVPPPPNRSGLWLAAGAVLAVAVLGWLLFGREPTQRPGSAAPGTVAASTVAGPAGASGTDGVAPAAIGGTGAAPVVAAMAPDAGTTEAAAAEAGEAPATPEAPAAEEPTGGDQPESADAGAVAVEEAPDAGAQAAVDQAPDAGEAVAEEQAGEADAGVVAVGDTRPGQPAEEPDAGETVAAAAEAGATGEAAGDPAMLPPDRWKCPGGMVRVHRKLEGDGEVRYEVWCIDRMEFPGSGPPRAGISLYGAKAACESRGRRLCTGAEWRRACGYKYPYGGAYDPERCNTMSLAGEERRVTASGRFRGCRSRWGVYDLVGNVAEWTADGMVRGGDNYKTADEATCGYARRRAPGSQSPHVGFRCCDDPKLKEDP